MKSIKIGLIGVGTIGSNTFNVLRRISSKILSEEALNIEVVCVADINVERAKLVTENKVPVFKTGQELIHNPNIDIIVELIGGCGFAKEIVFGAINNKKHVVTANKALIALHGQEIFLKAKENNVIVAFEASVAGAIPIIKVLRESLIANNINFIAGIMNGTSNFILSEMLDQRLSFNSALEKAKNLGFAEADPSFDIDGTDAAHKITIISSIAYGLPLSFEKVFVKGIDDIRLDDIKFCEKNGYKIKLIALAKIKQNKVEIRVCPSLIPIDHIIAKVDGAMNAILVKGDAIGEAFFYGQGAGGEPTASAVISDIVDISRIINLHRNLGKVDNQKKNRNFRKKIINTKFLFFMFRIKKK